MQFCVRQLWVLRYSIALNAWQTAETLPGRQSVSPVRLSVCLAISQWVSQSVSEPVIYEDINGMAMAAHSGPVGILHKYHGNASCETAEKFAKEGEREGKTRTTTERVASTFHMAAENYYISLYIETMSREIAQQLQLKECRNLNTAELGKIIGGEHQMKLQGKFN